MKKENFWVKGQLFLNSIVALLLLLSYVLPYISPKLNPEFTIIGLIVPILFLLNLFFVIYWIVKLRKYFLISTVFILLGIQHTSRLYKFSEKKVFLNKDMKVMNYNVRMLNHYQWSSNDSIEEKIYRFIADKDPDILTIQEFYEDKDSQMNYPYRYVKRKSKFHKFGLAILSKFPIINKGSLDLDNSANNIIYADILSNKDTIRIYNLHLESLKINPKKQNFVENTSDKLIERMKTSFQKQAIQVEQFLKHEKLWTGKIIVCGDFNNTAFSWVYRQISKNKKDAFKEAGKGLGKTFNYPYPLRIDFILPSDDFEVNNFKTYEVPYSDHYPILARIKIKETLRKS